MIRSISLIIYFFYGYFFFSQSKFFKSQEINELKNFNNNLLKPRNDLNSNLLTTRYLRSSNEDSNKTKSKVNDKEKKIDSKSKIDSKNKSSSNNEKISDSEKALDSDISVPNVTSKKSISTKLKTTNASSIQDNTNAKNGSSKTKSSKESKARIHDDIDELSNLTSTGKIKSKSASKDAKARIHDDVKELSDEESYNNAKSKANKSNAKSNKNEKSDKKATKDDIGDMALTTDSTESNNVPKIKSVSFVPYPHKKYFNDYLEGGVWVAGQLERVKSSLQQDFSALDNVQSSCLQDGIYLPGRKAFPKFHIFSTKEALQCFKGHKIYLSGDSYMEQMFIGLGEIMSGEVSSVEIMSGGQRKKLFQETEKLFKKLLKNNKIDIRFLYFHCHLLDFKCVDDAMVADPSYKEADTFITNVAIHYKGRSSIL